MFDLFKILPRALQPALMSPPWSLDLVIFCAVTPYTFVQGLYQSSHALSNSEPTEDVTAATPVDCAFSSIAPIEGFNVALHEQTGSSKAYTASKRNELLPAVIAVFSQRKCIEGGFARTFLRDRTNSEQ